MKIFTCIILLLNSVCIYSSDRYILCIDGGGSKTALQVIDSQGIVLPLVKNGTTIDKIEVSGSNINTVGVEGVSKALYDLFSDVKINNDKILRDILSKCYVVAGMAGIGSIDNKNAVIKLFEELGISKDRLLLATDAALALNLIQGQGAILIAGTGSICLGKKDNERYRVGGLGYLLGDEGSGYSIGLQALKIALAQEYGWGKPTSLTSDLRKLYGVSDLKEVVQAIYKGKILPAKIGSATPLVLEQANAQDSQAVIIINNAAAQLCDLVVTMVNTGDLFDCEAHLFGGLFKSSIADIFIKMVEQNTVIQQRRIRFINQAWQNASTLFAQKNICMTSNLDFSSWQAT